MVRTIVERTVAQKESARDAIRGMRLKAMSCFTTEGEADNPSGPTGINHATIQTGYGTTLDGYTIANYVDSQTIHRDHVLWSIITYNRNAARCDNLSCPYAIMGRCLHWLKANHFFFS